jgi:hypothetical protein
MRTKTPATLRRETEWSRALAEVVLKNFMKGNTSLTTVFTKIWDSKLG